MRFKDSLFYSESLTTTDPDGLIETGFGLLVADCITRNVPVAEAEAYRVATVLHESRRAEPAVIATALGRDVLFTAADDEATAVLAAECGPRVETLAKKLYALDDLDDTAELWGRLAQEKDESVRQYNVALAILDLDKDARNYARCGPDTIVQSKLVDGDGVTVLRKNARTLRHQLIHDCAEHDNLISPVASATPGLSDLYLLKLGVIRDKLASFPPESAADLKAAEALRQMKQGDGPAN